MKSIIGAAALFVLAGTSAHAVTTNHIVNGSFEEYTGNLNSSGWNFFSSAQVPGWDGDPNIEIQTEPTLNPDLTPQDGDHYAELDTNQNATLSQTVTLDAGKYLFSFWYSPRVPDGSAGGNNMTFSVMDGQNSGVSGSISNAPDATYPWRQWTEVKEIFFVTDDNTPFDVVFTALGPSPDRGCGNCGALIDNVSIAAMPLPAGLLLMFTGLGALVLTGRRKQA